MADEETTEEWRERLIEAIRIDGRPHSVISTGAGLGPTFIRDLIDREQSPSVPKLQKLCNYLGLNMVTLFSGEPRSSEDIAHELQNTALRRAFKEVDAQPRNIQKVILEGLRGQIKVAKAGDKQPVKAKPREKAVPDKARKTA